MGRPVEAPVEAARLGTYEIVRKLARGGMAELFLARTVGPEGFAKLVVLKKILPNYAENPKFVRLFLDEAKLVAQMDHPHIAHVYDMGKAGNDYFFTMEYVHGQDVRAVWRRGARLHKQLPVPQAIQIARSIAAALHYAHERTRDDGTLLGIVHRDVSPQNILISYDGAVKLVDFGVAKAATSTVKTRTGALKGKIAYMSPEQARGATIDRRSDIFSLGIVLWELVTGRRLYKAENDLAAIQLIINSKPQAPSQVRAECPTQLDAIIQRALAASPSDRYQTAEQMQLELDALAREQRYDQSDTALRGFMHEMFDEELKVWHDAHAQGQTLIDHMLSAQSTVLLGVAESDASDDDLDDDDDIEEIDDESQADSELMTSAPSTITGATVLQPTAPRQALFDDGPTTRHDPHEEDDSLPTQMMSLDAMPTIQLSVPPPPARPHSEPHMRPMSEPAATSPQFGVGRIQQPAAFPVAPAEWRRATEAAPTVDNAQETLTRHVLIACSVLIAIIVLLAVAFGGGNARPAADAAPGKVQMRVVP